ncbi:universal stress protein [Nocardioides panacis]|uniref:universal stress protein n=1 Tax=Nocardioides panacis TaxID=2849501 RepID=UPI00345E13ED
MTVHERLPILVAVGDSDAHDAALRFAAEQAVREHRPLRLVHVLPSSAGGDVPGADAGELRGGHARRPAAADRPGRARRGPRARSGRGGQDAAPRSGRRAAARAVPHRRPGRAPAPPAGQGAPRLHRLGVRRDGRPGRRTGGVGARAVGSVRPATGGAGGPGRLR